jgi:hypothetical protein
MNELRHLFNELSGKADVKNIEISYLKKLGPTIFAESS